MLYLISFNLRRPTNGRARRRAGLFDAQVQLIDALLQLTVRHPWGRLPADRPLDQPRHAEASGLRERAIADSFSAPVAKLRTKVQYSRLLQGGKVLMRMSKLRFAPIAL